MSVYNGENSITPWIGPTCYKKYLSVIVLSHNLEILDKIDNALREVHNSGVYTWKLLTVRSVSMLDLAKCNNITGDVAVDFVVIALDSSKLFCLEWAKQMLEQIHPDLMNRRVVLVNARGMEIHAADILTLQEEYKLDLLSANLHELDSANFLAQRLLKYIEVSIGIKTGMPNLHI